MTSLRPAVLTQVQSSGSPRFCGLTECPAVFQDQADLCFLMTSHQPAVASQILETSLIVNKGLWMYNTMQVLQPEYRCLFLPLRSLSCRSSHGWCGLPLWVPRHTGLALGFRAMTAGHDILSLRAGMEPDLQGSFSSSVIFGLKGYVAERKGEREEMQDAHVILNDITEECRPLSSLITRVSYFAVFDGHGGIRASKFAAQNLHQNLIRKFPKGDVISVEKTVKRCLLDTFKHTDEEFLKQASSQKPAWKDGSTATCVLAVDNTLYIANLGDSRAILCRYNEESQKHAALSLSKEHNPTQYEERMRIQKAGGNVRDGRVLGVLEVSRSIGDGQYKRCGVTSVPDIRRCQLTPNDRFILLACDGLFKVFTPEEAVNFILSCLEDEKIQSREGKPAVDTRYEAACNRLANKAVQRGSADNVTVMLVRIGH
ncbi:integrin-linked kinase-associated serine/threonine phosphatase 2C isoform X2 [Myotis myotis]|uniref:integrin-linked kinase-associated serine/threonine phosphatase 2C isoform X2 n=1 Tax=Myotis myotis TaxID=51298 RepID=UPI001749D0FB|nr:integrin-linked kinase-associated serine/threonine phosphatase 2C isoform X2 [Myotis myotis]